MDGLRHDKGLTGLFSGCTTGQVGSCGCFHLRRLKHQSGCGLRLSGFRLLSSASINLRGILSSLGPCSMAVRSGELGIMIGGKDNKDVYVCSSMKESM